MRTINNILAFVLTLGAPMAIAQQRAARTPPRPAPQASAVLTFDDNTKALPSNYSGDSFSQAFSRYSATATTKGEFETSAEFEARRNAAPNIPASVETYSFQIIPNDVSLTITYLADIRQFDVHLFETQGVYTIRGREPWPRRIVLNQRDLNRGSSIRQNAFGASIRVTQTARIVTSLALTNPLSGPGFVHHHYPILLDPGIDPRVLKSQLAVVVVCDVSQGDDSAMEYSSSTTPTFTSPVEEVTLYATLKARARGLWIYNSVTGRIYLRIDSL